MAKASDNVFPKVIVAEGTAPASPSAGQQKLFIDSADHKLKRKDSAGTVTVVEGGSYTDEQARDAIGAALVAGTGMTITVDDAGDTITLAAAGGSGGGWDHTLSLPLSTLTGWTAGAGAWAISSGVIRESGTGAASQRLRYTAAPIPQGELVAEVDIKIDTLAQGVNSRAGFLLGYPPGADTTNSILCCLRGNAGNTAIASVYWEYEGVTAGPGINLGSTIATATWHTFRVHKVGGEVTAWVNGTLIGTGHIKQDNVDASTFAFYSWGCDVSFRNLDLWTPTLP